MATTPEYALMAGAAYISTRDDINKIPVPLGWEDVPGSHANLTSSGFEAISFRRGNEIVISFAGTDFTSISDWLDGNIPLVTGLPSEQLRQAAAYYMQIQRANPNALITFTGHSLGGGLAALMGVFFNKAAFAFDEAPFKNSASLERRDELYNYLSGLGYTNIELAALINYSGLSSRENNVVGVTVQGEANSSLWPVSWFETIGGPEILLLNGGVENTSSIQRSCHAITSYLTTITGRRIMDRNNLECREAR